MEDYEPWSKKDEQNLLGFFDMMFQNGWSLGQLIDNGVVEKKLIVIGEDKKEKPQQNILDLTGKVRIIEK